MNTFPQTVGAAGDDYWRHADTLAANAGIPVEAVVKSDLLRLGLFFSDDALAQAARFKEKSYFIFSFDMVAQHALAKEARHRAPEEIALIGGPRDFLRTVVSVRLNPESPYRVVWQEERFWLFYEEEPVSDIELPARPRYYSKALSNGKPITDIAPTIEWGYLVYLTAFRLCQYWGEKEECQFCDINTNYRQQKRERSYTGVKSVEEIVEALEIIDRNDPERRSRAYTVTGGAVTKTLNELNEGEFYAQYARAIEGRFPGRWIAKAVVQALPLPEVRLLKDAGYRIYHPNYEVWDKGLFEILSPGKARYVGRDEWIRRLVDAAQIFGPEHVIPNFVAGIELARPHGFDSVPQALRSTGEGLQFFMSQGICPRFTVWCLEPNTVLSRTNDTPPPLEYYTELLGLYRDIHRRFRLPIPPGYGPAGRGRAVFSVSAFMDVLPENQGEELISPRAEG